MEKEKKIITSTVNLQERLFKYKAFLKTLPDEITKDQKKQLLMESAKSLMSIRKETEQIFRLMNSLDSRIIGKDFINKFALENGILTSSLQYIIDSGLDMDLDFDNGDK